jgi:hypothetical protein
VIKTTAQTTTSSSGGGGGSSWVPTTTTTLTRKDEFPLKKGSRGERVQEIQNAIIVKYGKTALPRFGADGDFGSEMQTALEKNGMPTVIDESTYNVILKAGSPDYSSLAKKIFNAMNSKSFSAVIDGLKKIRNTKEYSGTSTAFKKLLPWMGINKSLVSEMLTTFTSSSQKDALRLEFLRMGLKFDGSAWTLSGLPESDLLITTEATEITDPKHNVKVKVAKGMVLGTFLQSKEGWTLFKTLEKNKKLIVKSNTVKIHEGH